MCWEWGVCACQPLFWWRGGFSYYPLSLSCQCRRPSGYAQLSSLWQAYLDFSHFLSSDSYKGLELSSDPCHLTSLCDWEKRFGRGNLKLRSNKVEEEQLLNPSRPITCLLQICPGSSWVWYRTQVYARRNLCVHWGELSRMWVKGCRNGGWGNC